VGIGYDLTISGFRDGGDAAAVRQAARLILEMLGCARLSVDFSVMSIREARRLNRRFRGKTYAAGVLSFPMPTPAPGGPAGEVLICPSSAARQAARAGISRRRRLVQLATHGALHVLGYRHDDADSTRMMRALERAAGRRRRV
jgi:probable rRNA maturation factor